MQRFAVAESHLGSIDSGSGIMMALIEFIRKEVFIYFFEGRTLTILTLRITSQNAFYGIIQVSAFKGRFQRVFHAWDVCTGLVGREDSKADIPVVHIAEGTRNDIQAIVRIFVGRRMHGVRVPASGSKIADAAIAIW